MFRREKNDFFSIGGQVNNSSSQSEETLERAITAIKKFEMNTLAAPLYWYQTEREEGVYDFGQIDFILKKARENQLKVVFLWFGTWKNGASHYVPEWVRADGKRFPWVKNAVGATTRILSPIGRETMEADGRAVAKVLAYIKEQNRDDTVLAFQIENEPGLLGAPRDYGRESEEIFCSEIPEDMKKFLQSLKDGELFKIWKENGSLLDAPWKKTFGLMAEEIFSAYCLASYVENVAAAGKKVYDLPLYVNVWVRETRSRIPGIDYPSGGATSLVLDLWKYFAPHIDCLCPDIYFDDRDTYQMVCSRYSREDNVLYIPESHADEKNALHIFEAVEKHMLAGVHCFAIDSTIDNDGNLKPECEQFRHTVKILASMKPLLEKYQGTGKIYAVVQQEWMESMFFDFGDFWGHVYFLNSITDEPYIHLDCSHDDEEHVKVRGKGLIVYTGNGEFFLAGDGFKLVLIRKDNMEFITSSLRGFKYLTARNHAYKVVEEGEFNQEGDFVPKKVRCGDESDMGLWVYYDVGLVHAVLEM